MKRLIQAVLFTVVALVSAAASAQAPEPQYRGPFPQAQLDAMLAPVALYPDSLLSQILMAAAYPRDLEEAAAWSRDNPGVHGEEAVRSVQNAPWDPSVISLVAFPQVLERLAEDRQWAEDLGRAYLEQPQQVMDTIQQLRGRAAEAGNLRSSEEIVVERRGYDYVIEPASPEVVYVPYYDPRYVYGAWWWPDYPPVYWSPWPGYRYSVGYSGFGWGYGISLGTGFFFGGIDWPRRYVRYSSYRPWYYHGRDFRRGDRWAPDRYRTWHGRDGRWRDVNRDSRWRDGTGDTRWRDANRDPRWRDGTRENRPRDATNEQRPRDGTRQQWQQGDRRPYAAPAYDASTAAPAVRNPNVRPVAPAAVGDGVARPRPQYRSEPREEARVIQRAPQVQQYQRAPQVQPQQQQQYQRAPQVQPQQQQQYHAPQIQQPRAPVVEQQRAAPNPAARAEPRAQPVPERAQESHANPAERRSSRARD